IFNEYSKVPMTSFPTLSEGDIQDILAYVEDANIQAAAAASVSTASAGGTGGQSEGPSTLFVVLLVVLVVVVLLLSVVLLVVLNVLSRTIDGGKPAGDEKSGTAF